MSSSISSSRALRTIALFACLVAITLWGTGEGLRRAAMKLDYNVPKIIEMLSLRDVELDILVLGNSVTQQSYNPKSVEEQTGLRSYNAATGGQSPLASKAYFTHHLSNNPSPKMVVLGVFVNRHNHDAGIPVEGFDTLVDVARDRYLEDFRQITGADYPWQSKVTNWLTAYRHRGTIPAVIKYAVAGDSRHGDRVQGHLAIDYTNHGKGTLGGRHQASVSEPALRLLMAEIRGRGIPVLMFEPPGSKGYGELTEGRSEVLAMLERICAEDPGIAFVSLNDPEGLDVRDDEWVGANHLNAAGARRFSEDTLAPTVDRYFRAVHGREFRLTEQEPF